MPDNDPAIRVAIEHSIRNLSRWTITLYICVGIVAGGLFISASEERGRHAQDIARIDHALCTFVEDLQRRIDSSRDYLKKHKGEKEPIPGITRADLRLSVQRQQATIDSLDGLDCLV